MFQRKDWMAILLLVALVLAVFYKAVLGGVFYFGDIYQLHYPLHSAYARELSHGSLPLWTTDVLAGYPLLAEGQLGALYPPNLVLYALLPVPIAMNVFIVGHLCLAALGVYGFARRLRVHRLAALCSGWVYALGGFLVAHLNHINILACAAWLPWLFLLTDRLLVGEATRRRTGDTILLAVVLGLEFLAGHVQIALLSLLAVVLYALFLVWAIRPKAELLARFLIALGVGVGLAAAQLLPSFELTQLSVRAGGLDPAFFTSFSLHPLYLVSLLLPFVRGNPYPNASVELVGYVGWLPLLIALVAPFVRHQGPDVALRPVRRTGFFALLAVVGVLLALGRWNPAYMLLLRLPLFNLFRVPARYLYLFSFSVAMLTGLGLDALLSRVQGQTRPAEGKYDWLLIVVVALLVLLATSHARSVDDLVAVWRWLPLLLGLLAACWLVQAWLGHGSQRLLVTLALLLVVTDLLAFNAVYNRTYNQTMPLQDFTAAPRSLSFFGDEAEPYRLYTSQEIVPVLPVMRESYYPNLSLIQGLPSGNGNFPLVPERYQQYLDQMTPRMLDLLGIKYYLIPQVLPVNEASEFYDVEDRFTLNPVGRSVSIAPTQVVKMEVESYLSHSVQLPDGEPVAEIHLRGAGGEEEVIVLRAGWHTAEWAYDRSDVSLAIRHPQPQVARSWSARSGFPPENHRGFTYKAEFRLERPITVTEVEVRPTIPKAYLRIERLNLVDGTGQAQLLAHLANAGDHTLAYRNEDVAVYLNHDALPRAFIVHQARAVPDDAEALNLLRQPSFDPATEVLLATEQTATVQAAPAGQDTVEMVSYTSRKVTLRVHAAADGYLLLADAWYPGWRASVDGREAPILRADLVFRAVFLAAGDHVVQFNYAPQSFQMGLWVSVTAILVLVAVWTWGWLTRVKPA